MYDNKMGTCLGYLNHHQSLFETIKYAHKAPPNTHNTTVYCKCTQKHFSQYKKPEQYIYNKNVWMYKTWSFKHVLARNIYMLCMTKIKKKKDLYEIENKGDVSSQNKIND